MLDAARVTEACRDTPSTLIALDNLITAFLIFRTFQTVNIINIIVLALKLGLPSVAKAMLSSTHQ